VIEPGGLEGGGIESGFLKNGDRRGGSLKTYQAKKLGNIHSSEAGRGVNYQELSALS